MKQSIVRAGVGVALGLCVVASSAAFAQQARGRTGRGGGHAAVAAPPMMREVVAISLNEASNMLQRQGVFLIAPPAGSTAYGLVTLGEGTRIWALLPSCRRPNPDDPRDPCPVGRVTMTVAGGGGTIQGGEPQTVSESADDRRVQSFVVPVGTTTIQLRLLRHDDGMRYEANIDAAQLGQLPAAQGTPGGPRGFTFDLSAYPGR